MSDWFSLCSIVDFKKNCTMQFYFAVFLVFTLYFFVRGFKHRCQDLTCHFVFCQTYFPGTRSLSPMSSLFGSIWTPQSEPYQNHFQPDRSAPMSPVTPPHAPFSREPGGSCRTKQYFNPFGPHMNLDIWNSSSNRSSNSQLSNDSGYCGDVQRKTGMAEINNAM